MIVVDTNIIGHFFLSTESSALAAQVFAKDPDWHAPVLWQSELRSILSKYFRAKRLTLAQAQRIMDEAQVLMIDRERFVSSKAVLELMAASQCTTYDCEYAALAKEMNLPLVTLDKDLVRDFPQLAVFPQDFVRF